MLIPIGCLAISRDVLGLDDPISDNVSANVIGLLLGLVARFYLFRTFVFQRPISIVEIYDEPGLVERRRAARRRLGTGQRVGALARGRSTSGPARPPARGPAAG